MPSVWNMVRVPFEAYKDVSGVVGVVIDMGMSRKVAKLGPMGVIMG